MRASGCADSSGDYAISMAAGRAWRRIEFVYSGIEKTRVPPWLPVAQVGKKRYSNRPNRSAMPGMVGAEWRCCGV